MKIIRIRDKIDDGKNIIFFKRVIYDCFNELNEDFLCVYFSEPIPVKVRLIKIIQELNGDDICTLNRKTITELKEILLKQLKYESQYFLPDISNEIKWKYTQFWVRPY